MNERLKKYAPYAGYPLFYALSFFVFALLTFPFDKVKDRIVLSFNADQRKNPGPPRELQIDEMRSSWLTGVRFHGVRIVTAATDPTKPPSEIVIDDATLRVPFFSLFGLPFGHQTVAFRFSIGGGEVKGEASDSAKERSIDATLSGIDASQIPALTDMLGIPMEGKLGGHVELTLPEGKASKAAGTIALDVQDMAVGDGKAKLKGALALPRVNIGALTFAAEATNGALKVSKLSAGGKDVELSGDGRIQMRELATDSTCDMNVHFKINDAYRTKSDVTKSLFGAPGSSAPALFELADPKVKQAKRADGSYGFHLRGPLGRLDFDPAGDGGGGGSPGRGRSPF